jgi:hypothetical protein
LDTGDGDPSSFSVSSVSFGDGIRKFGLGAGGGEERFDDVPAALLEASGQPDAGS